jgi:hypothetical protein
VPADEGEPEFGVAAVGIERGQAAEHVPREQVVAGIATSRSAAAARIRSAAAFCRALSFAARRSRTGSPVTASRPVTVVP